MTPAEDRLERYREMRSFDRTPEPAGKAEDLDAGGGGGEMARFVVQEHHATRLHWDLRLERDGALASWAVPRGIPWSPERDHLAVHTEDHPLEDLAVSGPAWETPKHHRGDGVALFEAAVGQGVRGLVAKRLGSVYRPGERSEDWIAVRPS